MPDFQIIEAKPQHCGQMARRLRARHRAAIDGTGIDPHRELRARFDASAFRRALLIEGELAALGGVTGTALSPTGYVWFALTEKARKHSRLVVRVVQDQLDEIMITKRELATVVLPTDEAALRLAVFLGFHVADTGLGSRAHTRLETSRPEAFPGGCARTAILMGNGAVVPVGYHREAA